MVIGQRGWIWVGKVTRIKLDPADAYYYWRIEDAYCIRTWGTKQGLGELVAGPTAETVLDPAGVVECHELTVVGRYKADEPSWQAELLKRK